LGGRIIWSRSAAEKINSGAGAFWQVRLGKGAERECPTFNDLTQAEAEEMLSLWIVQHFFLTMTNICNFASLFSVDHWLAVCFTPKFDDKCRSRM
jgi:hypothetical protein